MDDSLSFVELNSALPGNSIISARIDIKPEDGELPEHFPGTPVVPAYMQLQWVEQVLNYKVPALQIVRFADVKFLQGIIPPCSVIIEILKSKIQNFDFKILLVESELEGEQIVVSKGKMFCEARS